MRQFEASRQFIVVLVAAFSLMLGGADAFAQDTVPLTSGGPLPKTPQALVNKSIKDLSHGSLAAAVKDDVKALRRGPLLIHGNYCGLGNRPGTTPTDALDAACMRHDACTKTGALPSCACDDRLRVEATAIAQDPRAPGDLQAIAAATAASMAVLICNPGQGHPVTPNVVVAVPPPQ